MGTQCKSCLKNLGLGGARKPGVLAATGEWVAFLDYDGAWHLDKTRQQLALADDSIAAVFSVKFAEMT